MEKDIKIKWTDVVVTAVWDSHHEPTTFSGCSSWRVALTRDESRLRRGLLAWVKLVVDLEDQRENIVRSV